MDKATRQEIFEDVLNRYICLLESEFSTCEEDDKEFEKLKSDLLEEFNNANE